jgi:hypothetical protein
MAGLDPLLRGSVYKWEQVTSRALAGLATVMTITATPASLSRGKICKKKSQIGEIDALLSTAPTTRILERYTKRETVSVKEHYTSTIFAASSQQKGHPTCRMNTTNELRPDITSEIDISSPSVTRKTRWFVRVACSDFSSPSSRKEFQIWSTWEVEAVAFKVAVNLLTLG